MNATTYGLDVAKHVSQPVWVDGENGEIVNRRFRRDELILFLSQRPAGRVVALGSVVSMKTRTDYCGSISPKVLAYLASRKPN